MSATLAQRINVLAPTLLALGSVIVLPVPNSAADDPPPPHLAGTIQADGSKPPKGFFPNPLYGEHPTVYWPPILFPPEYPLGNQVPDIGSANYDGETSKHDEPTFMELATVVPGMRTLNGNAAGIYRAEHYFRLSEMVSCPDSGCAPGLGGTFYARWGNVKGAVLLTDGSPAPAWYVITATPVSLESVPPEAIEAHVFDPKSVAFRIEDGAFDFRSSFSPFMEDPNCSIPGTYYYCHPIPIDPANEWGLPVLGDGGADHEHSKFHYSNERGKFKWRITLSTKLPKEEVVEVRSSTTAYVLFHLSLSELKEVDAEQRENRDKYCNAPHPVSLITGNVFLDQTDIRLPGLYGDLEFTRSYNTMAGPVSRDPNAPVGVGGGVLGKGWSHTYGATVEKLSDTLYRLWQASGTPAYYSDSDHDGIFVTYGAANPAETLRVTPTGYTRSFRAGGAEEYDSNGALVRMTDRLGRATTLTRDTSGRLVAITSPEGRVLRLEYEPYAQQIARLIGPQGIVAEFSYRLDAKNYYLLTRVEYADGTGYAYTYTKDMQLETVSDLQGVVLERHGYNGTKAAWSELNDGMERNSYSFEDGRTVVTNATGSVSVFEYTENLSGRHITKITGCGFCGGNQGGTQLFEYDDDGRLRSNTDADGHTTQYVYSGADLVAETNALGRTTTYAGYDAYGRPGTVTAPGWGTTTFTWAPEGLRTATLPGGATTTYTHAGQRLSRIDTAAGASYLFDIDASGQLRGTTDARGKTTTFEYAAGGLLKKRTLPDGTATQIIRDVRGRPTKVTRADGKASTISYDGSGRLASVTDEALRTWRYSYDPYNRLQAVIDPLRGTTRFTFDSMSHLTSLTDAKGQTTSFTYDDHGRLWRKTDPVGHAEELTYYPSGRLHTLRDRKGVLKTYTYDAIGRITGVAYTDGTPPVAVTYDDDARAVTLANGTDTVTRTYDPSGTLQSEASQRNDSVVSYGYVGAYLPQTVSLDGAEVARFAYEADYLRSIQASGASFGFEYDDQGRRTALTRPNGIRTTYSYTANLPWLEHIGIEGSAAALDATYTHDAVGNRLAKTAGDVAEQYGYDPLDRLTTVMRAAPLSSQSTFGYDAVGNRTRQQVDGMSRSLSTDAANRLLTSQPTSVTRVTGTTSEPANVTVQGQTARILPGNAFEAEASASGTTPTITVQATDGSGNTRTNTYQLATQTDAVQHSYDLNGNLLTKTEGSDSWVYTWNAENQLTRVQKNGAEVARFAYDPFGRRVEKIAGGVTTRYTYDGDDILREARGSATLQYVHGPGIDEPLAVTEGGARTYFHADGLGSIVATTDAAGNVTSRRQYDAWGNLEVGADQPGYAFTGREWDPETGLYYYRARYYDPTVGRFISEDPIGFWGGDVNLYSYVADQPTMFIDPLGLEMTTVQIANIVYNETRSLSGSPEIDAARQDIAHVVINGDEAETRSSGRRPITASDVANVPSSEQSTWESCRAAVERARLEREFGYDPTYGARHFNMRGNASRRPFLGNPLRTQYGPLNNSFPSPGLPRSNIYVNTYR